MPTVTLRSRYATVVRLSTIILVIILMVWTFMSYHHPQPSVRSVDGTYRSDCCGEILIHNGTVVYGNKRAKIKLVLDKFGLAANLDRPLGPFYVLEGMEKRPAVFSFDNRNGFSVVDHAGNERRFARMTPASGQ